MKQGVTREVIVKSIKSDLEILVKELSKIQNIADALYERHDIPKSLIFEMTDSNNDFTNIEITELGLVSHYIALELGRDENWIQQFFTKSEILRLKTYKRIKQSNEVLTTFHPAIKIRDNVFIVAIHWRDIAKMYDKGIFIWDERVQREGVRRNYNDSIIVLPKINQTNVNEIKDQVLKGILMENELAYNLVLDSSSEGQELYYDDKKKTLTLAGDFLGHIIDGMHRTVGIHQAWMENPNIEGYMPVRISNYDIEESKRYQVEQAKATPIDKSRLRMLDDTRITDKIVDKLMVSGFLRDRISSESRPNKQFNMLVSYKTLSDAFYESFGKKENPKILAITKSFQEYLDYLFELYSDEYMNEKDSLLFKNYGFHLHVKIFEHMFDNNIPMSNLEEVLDVNYFNTNYIKENYGYDMTIQTDAKVKSKKYGLALIENMLNKHG